MNSQLHSPNSTPTTVFDMANVKKKSTTLPALPSREATARPRFGHSKLIWLGAVAVMLATGAFFRFQYASSPESVSTAGPTARQVNVTSPERASAGDLQMPGTVLAYQATDLLARASGFVKSWTPEIGTLVKKGDVLAEIETPELDQELSQAIALHRQGQAEYSQAVAELAESRADVALAQANVVKAKANVDFAVSQANRYETLLQQRAASRQEVEGVVRERDARNAELEYAKADLTRRKTTLTTKQAIIESREAIVRNREANMQRLRDLTGFQKLVAPFDGVITRRNIEVGMLVNAGSGTGSRPLFSVAQVDVLRVQVSVPQSSALSLKAGDPVQVTIPERPGVFYRGTVARTAGAVEPTSRSLLVEVELDNREAKLLPGLYAQVRFHSNEVPSGWVVPANALLMRSDGPHVVVVTRTGVAEARKVTLGREFGMSAEVVSGLTGEERLIVNPAAELRDGQPVEAVPTRK